MHSCILRRIQKFPTNHQFSFWKHFFSSKIHPPTHSKSKSSFQLHRAAAKDILMKHWDALFKYRCQKSGVWGGGTSKTNLPATLFQKSIFFFKESIWIKKTFMLKNLDFLKMKNHHKRDWKGFQCLTVRLDTFWDFLRRLKPFETFGIVWEVLDCLTLLWLFETFGDVLRLLRN